MARKARPNPLTVRLSPDERAELAHRAERAGLTVGGYFRAAVLDAPLPRITHRPDPNRAELARLLAAVGHIGGNINQLAYVANTGDWPEKDLLDEAVSHIRWMRHHLMLALGVTPSGPDGPAP